MSLQKTKNKTTTTTTTTKKTKKKQTGVPKQRVPSIGPTKRTFIQRKQLIKKLII